MKKVGVFEGKTHFSALIDQARNGQTIIVTKNGEPVAQIGPIPRTPSRKHAMEAMKRILSERGNARKSDDSRAESTRDDAIKAVGILDASAAIAWLFVDERDEAAVAMAQAVARQSAVVPPLFRWEVQNALLMAVRRKRLSLDGVAAALQALDELDCEVDRFIAGSPLATGLEYAQRFSLPAYDAAYLELGVRRRLPIMTRDENLARAAATLDLLWAAA